MKARTVAQGLPIMQLMMQMVAALFLTFCLLFLLSSSARSDPLQRGVQGAIGGAIIGGIAKGRKGILPGVAIGGAVGVIGGAIEKENARKRRYRRARKRRHDKRRHYQKARVAPGHAYSPPSDLVADIQQSLVTLGYDPGPVDGRMGSQTSGAIEEYESNYGLLITGKPSPQLLDHMRQQGG